MTRVVWVTGRAATGKSSLVSAVTATLRAWGHHPRHLCDERLLPHLVAADTAHQHHLHPHGDHRIEWRTGQLFDTSVG